MQGKPNNVIVILKREGRPARFAEVTCGDTEEEKSRAVQFLSVWIKNKIEHQQGYATISTHEEEVRDENTEIFRIIPK